MLIILVYNFVLYVLPDQIYSKSVLPSSRTSGIGFGENGEYECYGLICNVAKHLPFSLTFKRCLKRKHKPKM